MTATTVEQLEIYGPARCDTMDGDRAAAWCAELARGRYENFSVLSGLVPRRLRPDFAAIYAFCRWADDLGDEVGDRGRALELLGWWRDELRQCFAGRPRHPVFVALAPVVQRHGLPIEPFDDLIGAFEQDQRVDRYDTWDQLLEYCRRSANPVGRLVLMVSGEPRTESLFKLSDCICTALQLTNHLQDVRRDILERNRIYIPREMIQINEFERRLLASARQRHAVDRTFLEESRVLIRACVERTWTLFETGAGLLDRVSSPTRPLIWLFAAGGQSVLRRIETWNYETVLHRPRLGAGAKLWLIAQARFKAITSGFRHGAGP